ncbi:MAG: selenocysteine-specific elongation factor [Acidimicrobiaceae bacterium]|jgi:selenocysteine-specific elongation factor
MHVVATAGHVDHGKSTLVLALTNIDPDRFAEEKRRGLTIDLGFAWTVLPSGRGIAFVDVPGHVRFLKNMLAGVGAVDACVFVVAATEGWKPQSEEHLRILELLGLEHGVIALTKVGIVDDDHAELARLDVIDHVEGTFLEGAEIIAVDAPTGVGLGGLRLALDRLLTDTPSAADLERPRLWVDRSFAAAGAGTVVTGTLTGGALSTGDELLVTNDAGDHEVRVRGLQSLGQSHASLGPGNRTAVNLVGVHHHDVARGDALVRPGQWHRTQTIDASLRVLDALDHEVSRRGAYVAYIGSGEHPVRLRILGPSAIGPGEQGLVRLHLPTALPLVPGDRYVLRESGRSETVGGGEVLDIAPALRAAKAHPDRSVERVIAERGWVDATELERLTGERRAPTVGRWVVDEGALAEAKARLQAMVSAAGPLGLDVAALDERDRAVLTSLDAVVVSGGRAATAGADDPLSGHPFVAALEASPFMPPSAEDQGVDRAELRELVRRDLVVEQDGVWFAPAAIAQAAATIGELLRATPDGVTVAEVREALSTTRKWAVPLLTILDARGITRRRGDVRVAGPRLPH